MACSTLDCDNQEEAVVLESLKTAVAGLAATHALWALSLLLDGQRYLLKPVIPPLFAIAHLAIALLLTAGHRTHGHLLATPVLTYYMFFVKPFEPIAEPQTVGILGVTAALLVREIGKTPAGLWRIILRLGIAYPLVEWGLDAFRNPAHFKAYLSVNPITSRIIPAEALDYAVTWLGVYELALASLILSGMLEKAAAAIAAATFLAFTAVAGYPLAFPQNIALAAAATLHPSPPFRKYFENSKTHSTRLNTSAPHYPGMAVKATMYVYGSVQAVGYRVYVKNVAALMGVRGLVRNRGDGSVEIFAEAEKGVLDRFMKAIDVKGRPGDILSLNVERLEVRLEGEPGYAGPWRKYTQFEIDYGEEIGRPVEREMVESLELAKLYFTKLITEFKDFREEFRDYREEFRDYREEFRDYREEFRDYRHEFRNFRDESLSISREILGEVKGLKQEFRDYREEFRDFRQEFGDFRNGSLNISREILDTSKEVLGEVKGLRKDLQTILDERLTKIEKDIAAIKAKIGLL
jgi:acylphosphatase/uncharacterized membrane protein YphA (DoxX/SURF4 family)